MACPYQKCENTAQCKNRDGVKLCRDHSEFAQCVMCEKFFRYRTLDKNDCRHCRVCFRKLETTDTKSVDQLVSEYPLYYDLPDHGVQCVYIVKVKNKKNLYRFGITRFMRSRIRQHQNKIGLDASYLYYRVADDAQIAGESENAFREYVRATVGLVELDKRFGKDVFICRRISKFESKLSRIIRKQQPHETIKSLTNIELEAKYNEYKKEMINRRLAL